VSANTSAQPPPHEAHGEAGQPAGQAPPGEHSDAAHRVRAPEDAETKQRASVADPASAPKDAYGAVEASSAELRTPRTSAFQSYVAELRLPLAGVLAFLSIALGGLGYGLRPGTDTPPAVSVPGIQLYVFQRQSSTGHQIPPTAVTADETLIQKNRSTVELQLDLFGSFAAAGEAYWDLLTAASNSPPHSCPDPYQYLGAATSTPLIIRSGILTLMGQDATRAVLSSLVGRRTPQVASDSLGLTGQSAAAVAPNISEPLGIISMCWDRDEPLAFDGEYASAAIPSVSVYGVQGSFHLTRSLYFENPIEDAVPLTAEYSLQAGSLPTSSDPMGWHWAGSYDGPIQLTAINISESQHETYLGFLSGVIFGVAGGAFVSLLQEALSPIRRRKHGRAGTSGHAPERSPAAKTRS